MAAHRPHPIRTEHFDHWLALWRDTAEDVLSPAQARIFCDYAARIARSLQYGLGLEGAGGRWTCRSRARRRVPITASRSAV